jgi:hypothetical protein
VEKYEILSPTQCGFRKGRGTKDCVALLSTAIQSSFERKQQTLVGFLDISGAYYDNVEPSVAKRNGFFYYDEGKPVAESVGFKGLPQGLYI